MVALSRPCRTGRHGYRCRAIPCNATFLIDSPGPYAHVHGSVREPVLAGQPLFDARVGM